jgi:hypothetical protein
MKVILCDYCHQKLEADKIERHKTITISPAKDLHIPITMEINGVDLCNGCLFYLLRQELMVKNET